MATMNEAKKERMECDCCSHRTKMRTPEELADLNRRLNRIEGQIKGIRGMLEKNAYCPDILMQVSAANAALNSFTKQLCHPACATGRRFGHRRAGGNLATTDEMRQRKWNTIKSQA